MPYGQHQSFHLRDRWISKALKSVKSNNRFFYEDSSFEKIGLGKNMVQSLRFWTESTKILDKSDGKKHLHNLSKLGELILAYDKVILFNDTAGILHYHLVTDKDTATTWYWFFNKYNEKVTSKEDILNELINWTEDNEKKKIALSSLKKDVDCLVRLYTTVLDTDDPEEIKHSPLTKLNLIKDNEGVVYKNTPDLDDIGYSALMYVLLDYCKKKGTRHLTVSQILDNENLWGKVFNLNRRLVINALDKLSRNKKFSLQFIRTNGLDDVQVPDIDPSDYLEFEYKRLEKEINVGIQD